MTLEPGTSLGPYRIVSQLGAGAMGEVYRAHDDRLNRLVALKVLSAERVANADRRQRFRQEAQLASALQHPNIVTIFDIGSAEGVEYLAMELVRGRTLDTLITHRGLSLQTALRYAGQIVDALAAAHATGIVHRDLKPANIMVTAADQIKILDFGLATLSGTNPGLSVDETRLLAAPALSETEGRVEGPVETNVGTILGTVAYMSPEQAQGRPVDARSDLFSFGAIFYEMLSGLRAFHAVSTPDTLAAVIKREPEPLALVARHVPADVDRLVSACLQKDPNRRPQSASEIRTALDVLQQGSGRSAATPGIFSGHGLRIAIGAAVVAVATTVAVLWWWPKPAPTSFSPVPLTALPGSESFPTFSPDGSQVAFTWLREGGRGYDVFAQTVGSGTPVQLTDDGSGHMFPSWSPDGTSIALWHVPRGTTTTAVTTQGRLVIVPPLGGAEREIYQWSGAARRISWSPDGRWIAISPVSVRSHRERGITLVSPATGEVIEWTTIDKAFAGSADPVFSPDGKRLAYTRTRDDFSSDLYLATIGTDGKPIGPPVLLPYGGKEASFPVWTSDGRSLLIINGVPSSNGGVLRVPVDAARSSQPLAGLEHAGSLALAGRSGRLAFHRPGIDVDIWQLDMQNPPASGRVAPSTLWEEGADYSSDGSRLAFSSNRSGAREIWVADVSGDNALQLTDFGGPVPGTARWSPDDKQVVFDARPGGNSEIFIVAAGGGPIRQLTNHPGEDARPAWSHDGRSIFFSSNRSGRSEIWKMSADGTSPVQVTKDGASTVEVSPDGEWIFYQTLTPPLFIHRARPDSSDVSVVVSEDVRIGLFAPTTRGLWFVTNPVQGQPAVVLKRLSFADRTISEMAKVDFVPIPVGLAISPDERHALITRNDRNGSDLLLVNRFR